MCLSYFPPLVPFSLFLSHSFLLLSLTPPSSSLSSLSSPPLLLSLLPLSSFLSRQIMYQIFSAVEHMHTHHVVHRDLKVMNTSMQCKYIVCKPVYWSMRASLLEYASQFTGVCKPVYWSMQASLLEYATHFTGVCEPVYWSIQANGYKFWYSCTLQYTCSE